MIRPAQRIHSFQDPDAAIKRNAAVQPFASVATLAVLCAFMAVSLQAQAQNPPSRSLTQAPCRPRTFENQRFTVCEVDLHRSTIKLFWKRPDGQAYAYLSALPKALKLQAEAPPAPSQAPGQTNPLQFATNAGMYQLDLSPVGLFIDGRRQLKSANTHNGPGNFHMKPNGVFYVQGDTAGVMETGAFLKARISPEIATQSGPMLVINGRLHPKFQASGPSLKTRSGVGVRDAATAVFAISLDGVSFGTFARLFRDELKTPNALYLDGSISSLYQSASQTGDNLIPLGPMLGIYDKVNPISSKHP